MLGEQSTGGDIVKGEFFRSGLNRGQLDIVKGAILSELAGKGPNYDLKLGLIDERIAHGLESMSIAPNELNYLEALGKKLAQDFVVKDEGLVVVQEEMN